LYFVIEIRSQLAINKHFNRLKELVYSNKIPLTDVRAEPTFPKIPEM